MKLNYGKTVFIGLAFLSICSFWQLYETVVPLILTRTFHLGDTLTGAVMALDNILGIFLIPFFGSLSDKSTLRMGRRSPFILLGTAVTVVSMLFLPFAERIGSFPLFFGALWAVLLALSFYRSPAAALMPDLTPAPLRSKANAVVNLMGACGSVITLSLLGVLIPGEERPDYTPAFLAVAFVMAVSVGLLALRVRETRASEPAEEGREADSPDDLEMEDGKILTPAVKRSLYLVLLSVFFWYFAFNAVTTAFSRYAANVWGLEGGSFAVLLIFPFGAAVVSYLPAGHLAARIGRKNTILVGVVILTASYLAEAFLSRYSLLVPLGLTLIGAGWAFVNVNSFPMVVEMCSRSEMGKYSGLYYSFSMSAQIITPILSGFLFERLSYMTLFPYAAVFSLCSLLTMLFVRHGEASSAPQGRTRLTSSRSPSEYGSEFKK